MPPSPSRRQAITESADALKAAGPHVRQARFTAAPGASTDGTATRSPAGLLALQRSAGNAVALRVLRTAPETVQRKMKDFGTVELTEIMERNHVAGSEQGAQAATQSRIYGVKDPPENTVLKGTSASIAKELGEGEDGDYESTDDDYGLQWVKNMKFWHYGLGLKGGSGYKLDTSEEHEGDVQVKVWTKKTAKKTFVKVTGINQVDF